MNITISSKKMMMALFAAGMIAVVSVVLAVSAFAVGTNGSFETGDNPGSFVTVATGGTAISDWNVTSGNVDYIGTYWTASNGSRSIDLNGTEPGVMTQGITTEVGATYTVTFDMSGNPDDEPGVKSLTVMATGDSADPYSFDTSVNNTVANMMWTQKTYSFVATSINTTLTFASTISGAYGPAIDNVVVTKVAEAPITPTEPPTGTPTVTPTVTPTPGEFAVPAECSAIAGLGAPILGTNGSNIINGTNGNDLIFARGGSDVVNGKNGNDCIVAGSGSDVAHGDNGEDVILGGAGSDSLYGDNGQDKLYGEGGADSLRGGNGNDELVGGAGSDAAIGGAGNQDVCTAESKASCEL